MSLLDKANKGPLGVAPRTTIGATLGWDGDGRENALAPKTKPLSQGPYIVWGEEGANAPPVTRIITANRVYVTVFRTEPLTRLALTSKRRTIRWVRRPPP